MIPKLVSQIIYPKVKNFQSTFGYRQDMDHSILSLSLVVCGGPPARGTHRSAWRALLFFSVKRYTFQIVDEKYAAAAREWWREEEVLLPAVENGPGLGVQGLQRYQLFIMLHTHVVPHTHLGSSSQLNQRPHQRPPLEEGACHRGAVERTLYGRPSSPRGGRPSSPRGGYPLICLLLSGTKTHPGEKGND